jgi:hypothetical protein
MRAAMPATGAAHAARAWSGAPRAGTPRRGREGGAERNARPKAAAV